MVEAQVGQGLHITRLHIHQDGAALLGFVDGQGVVERALYDVLQLDVKGRDDVVAIQRIGVVVGVDGDPGTMVDATHQLSTVLTSQVVVIGAFKAEEVALLLVGHAQHEAGEVFVGMLAANLLVDDEAVLVEATVEDDELLHLAQFRLCDV